jgi:hypothetical protein
MDRQQRDGSLTMTRRRRWLTMAPVAAFVVSICMASLLGPVSPLEAGFQQGGGAAVLIGPDDDNGGNPIIHRPGIEPDQSLNSTDILIGGNDNDIVIGKFGNDVIHGGLGKDILIGGPEQGTTPNNDIIFGDFGNDISIWSSGDGNDAVIGAGGIDAQVFGVIDLGADGLPVLTPVGGDFAATGVPTANVSGMDGRCELDLVTDPVLGYEWLVRFFVRSSGESTATVRLAGVEHVFCPGPTAGQIVFADLTAAQPTFVVVTFAQVQQVNSNVSLIIR